MEKDLTGQTLGRYEITALIGRGGMATVYQATHPGLEQTVAVKVLHAHLADDPNLLERFKREAQAVAALRHINIVRVTDFDYIDDVYFMVMEYVEGFTLSARLSELAGEGRRMPAAEVLTIFEPLCAAVDYAHGKGLIHRDIKPANVLLTASGEPVLTDYGIAKILGATPTATGIVMGTAQYMSPEQARGIPVDERTDIYSLGVVLFESLTGRVPYEGDSLRAILAQHMMAPVPSVHRLNHDLPLEVDLLMRTAMAKNPGERMQTGQELADALRRWLGSPASTDDGSERPTNLQKEWPANDAPTFRKTKFAPAPGLVDTAETVPSVTLPAPTIPGGPVPPIDPSRPPRRGPGPALLFVIIVLVLAATVAAAILLSGHRGSDDHKTPRPTPVASSRRSPSNSPSSSPSPGIAEQQSAAKNGVISAGGSHTVGLRVDGTAVAVGDNMLGQCRVSSWSDLVAVSAGGLCTVGLRADGTAVAVGWTALGQGDVSSWSDLVSVSAGGYHTVGLRADGTVLATGSNDYGECDVSSWSDLVAVSAGPMHTVGMRTDGTSVAVGRNEYGQCDVSSWTLATPPSGALTITKLSPASAKRGATVTISGRNLGGMRGAGAVRFGSKACTTYVSWIDTQIKCKVPTKAKYGAMKVAVTTATGMSIAASFTVKR